MRLAGGEDVGDAAADRELARLVRGIFAGETGVHQTLGEIERRDVLPRLQHQRRAAHAIRRRHARQQRGRRGDDHARGSLGDGVEGAGPHRGDADVRREAAIRIDFVRRKRQHRALGGRGRQSFEGGEEKTRRRRRFSSRSPSPGTT